MSISAVVTNYVNFSGDQESELIFSSEELTDSPCIQQLVILAVGNNPIEIPSITDFSVHGVAIVPPSLNTTDITLKGVAGDAGLALSPIHASVIHFGESLSSIVLSVTMEIRGLRLVWF